MAVKINWREPIEAFHEDGRVVPARYHCWGNGDVAHVSFDRFEPNEMVSALPNGYVGHGWKIRNVSMLKEREQ